MKQSRELTIDKPYLNLPVKNGQSPCYVVLTVDGEAVRRFSIELTADPPDFWAFVDVRHWIGRRLGIHAQSDTLAMGCLEGIVLDDEIRGERLYREQYRPQFHFSSRRGWNNDPNGLLYYAGEYHLFYQHNPYGWPWGNMHWGHAVSNDLVHWQELGDALLPDELGTCFSGSGVVDWRNTSGLQVGGEKPLLCIYTAAGGTSPESEGQPFTQCIAYSTDRGRTWHKYAHNPVLGHIVGRNRDPKVIWHEPSQRWIMALYLEGNRYALLASPDLKAWNQLCELELPGCSECPDLFKLPVDGDPQETRWLFWGANGTYLLGHFDGATFEADGPALRYDWGGHSYAAQTWSDIPPEDGRRIQIAWLRANMPGMPFNQQMTFPCELTLRRTPLGIRLFAEPVREIQSLRAESYIWEDLPLVPGENPLGGIEHELLDIQADFALGSAQQFGFYIRGFPVLYEPYRGQLLCGGIKVPLAPIEGHVRLRLLVDRASLEIFGNDGLVAIPLGLIPAEGSRGLQLCARGGAVRVSRLEVHALRSIWE